MSQLANILSIENILLDINVTSKKRVFEQAALLFENNQAFSARSLTVYSRVSA